MRHDLALIMEIVVGTVVPYARIVRIVPSWVA
jgi:hypothetical protein